ncbi:transcription termination/antitermination protein NusA [candidate division KSB3 bacterium]|uniref:Transcription termination/antitermination protein NusA n=1 Tax=candidate division KSB3 bacterium TaxID=2044937 RepID=A0A2G6E236_9BACT|nr:MAG: transcription termination/antitermination protein NusA [candidate division KSB3 bacterium]PIE28573.1 MAG: transcription termination/antitermination protein NusA [candidate division KSB3 bacterium]
MNRELIQILEQVAREKGLPVKVIVEAVVTAIELAAKKRDKSRFDVEYDENTGTLHLYAIKEVVEEVVNPKLEIDLESARKIKANVSPGDEVYLERDISNLGRISAQKAKQIISQKVKEAEKLKVFELYKDRIGDLILGIVQRVENGVVVELGTAEAILPRREQIPGEFYKRGDKIRAYILDVKMSSSGKWPQIILSRTCDDFLYRLFEIEVPEIADGIVELVSVAREPGARAKIGVRSFDRNVDPVGACVGMRGARIQSIVRELRGEKIDIIEWSDDPATLVSRAITPASVQHASVYPDEKTIDIVVADDELALAIGKKGQNARLAVRLTQWKINILSEAERRTAVQESFDMALAEADFPDTGEAGENEQASERFDSSESCDAAEEDAYEEDDESIDADDEGHDEKLDDEGDELSEGEGLEDGGMDDAYDGADEENELYFLPGIEDDVVEHLLESGFSSIEEIVDSSVDDLISSGIDGHVARKLLDVAVQFLDASESSSQNLGGAKG